MYWYTEAMKKYAVFTGRARRKEYWTFHLVNIAIVIILVFAFALLIPSTIAQRENSFALIPWLIVFVAFVLATLIPGLAVSVRRLHDTNLSGWWLLLSLVPLGGIVLLVFHLLDSNPGPNRYGPNPKDLASLPPYAAQYPPYGTKAMATAAGANEALPSGQWFLGFCNGCGTSMQAGARFCPKCGKAAY